MAAQTKNYSFFVALFLSAAVFIFGCDSLSLRSIKASTADNLIETKLGGSNYYVSIPDNFEIKEARGKEGQLGYSITPKEHVDSTMYGFIEIKHGSPVVGSGFSQPGKSFARSTLANKEVTWIMERTETGYYSAFTAEYGDLNAKTSSKDQKEVESMIAIIATLKTK